MDATAERIWPGTVTVLGAAGRQYQCFVRAAVGSSASYCGHWHTTAGAALAEAADWLESRGYVHPTTHEV